MQQTNKYQLNLIETSDTFSPAPLNENMEKVEAAISAGDAAEAAARAAGDAALDARVQVLELHKFACGTYTGNTETYGASQFIELGFTPAAVFIPGTSTKGGSSLCVADRPLRAVKIVPGGFMVYYLLEVNSYDSANTKNRVYTYLAFC